MQPACEALQADAHRLASQHLPQLAQPGPAIRRMDGCARSDNAIAAQHCSSGLALPHATSGNLGQGRVIVPQHLDIQPLPSPAAAGLPPIVRMQQPAIMQPDLRPAPWFGHGCAQDAGRWWPRQRKTSCTHPAARPAFQKRQHLVPVQLAAVPKGLQVPGLWQ